MTATLVALFRREGLLVAVPPIVCDHCDACPTSLDVCSWYGCTRDMRLEALPEEVA